VAHKTGGFDPDSVMIIANPDGEVIGTVHAHPDEGNGDE